MSTSLKLDILEASDVIGLNPYTQPFKPIDLDLIASKYGSFADHCDANDSLSGVYAKEAILKVVERQSNGRPFKYILIN